MQNCCWEFKDNEDAIGIENGDDAVADTDADADADDASTTTAMQLHIIPPKAIDFQEKQDHDS